MWFEQDWSGFCEFCRLTDLGRARFAGVQDKGR
jgi:hypothetical protein